MTLYFTDSLGNKTVIAKDVKDPVEAMEKIMANQATRFVHSSGVCKITATAPDKFTFASSDGNPTGYTLEA